MKKFTGIWVPAEVWQMEALSYGHCLMLGHLLTLSKATGRCNPSNAALGQLFRLKDRQVRQLLHDLSGWNLLDIQGEGKARELVPTRQFFAGLVGQQPGDFSPGTDSDQPGSFPPEPGSFSPGSEGQPGDFSPTNPAVFRQQPGDFSPGIYKDGNKDEIKKEINPSSSPAHTHEEVEVFSKKNDENDAPEWLENERKKITPFEAKKNAPTPVAPAPSPATRDTIRAMLLGNEASRIIASNHNRERPFEEVVEQFLNVRQNDKADPWTDAEDCRRHFRNWIPYSTLAAVGAARPRAAPKTGKPGLLENHQQAAELTKTLAEHGFQRTYDPYGLDEFK